MKKGKKCEVKKNTKEVEEPDFVGFGQRVKVTKIPPQEPIGEFDACACACCVYELLNKSPVGLL